MLNSFNNLSDSLPYDAISGYFRLLNSSQLGSTFDNTEQLNLSIEEKCIAETTTIMSPSMINDLLNAFPISPSALGEELETIVDSTTVGGSEQGVVYFDNSSTDLNDIFSVAGELFDGSSYYSPEDSKQSSFPAHAEDDFTEIEDILQESMKAWSGDDSGGRQASNDHLDIGMEESVNSNPLLQWHLCTEQTFPEAVVKENMIIEKEAEDALGSKKQGKKASKKMTRKSSEASLSVSSSSSSISSLSKNSAKYLEKREKNNESVRKSRDKARQKQMETMEKVKSLTEENDKLNNKVNDLLKELEILKNLFANISNVNSK